MANFVIIRLVDKRLILIGFTFFVLAVAAFAIFLGGKTNSENVTSVTTTEKVESTLLENGLYRINYPSSDVSFQIPEKWNPVAFDDIEKGVAFGIDDPDGSAIAGFFSYFRDPSMVSIESFKKEHPGYWFETSESGETKILYYLGDANPPLIYEVGDGDFNALETNRGDVAALFEGYVVGKLIISKDFSAHIGCQLIGPNYASHISSCNDIVDSLEVAL